MGGELFLFDLFWNISDYSGISFENNEYTGDVSSKYKIFDI